MLFIGNTFLTKAEVSTHEEIKRVSSATIIFIYDVVVITTAQIYSTRLNSGSLQVQVLLVAC